LINIVFRSPKNSNSLICSMRIHLVSLDCFVFMSATQPNDAKDIRSRCIANVDLLRVHPLYFLSIVYENRYDRWTTWIEKVWNQVAIIETVTNMTHPDWRAGSIQSHEVQSMSTVESFLHQLHATNLELCHSSTVMAYASRFGNRCLDIINEAEDLRKGLGMTSLSPRQGSELNGSFGAILERLTPLSDRVSELKQRLSSQITAVRIIPGAQIVASCSTNMTVYPQSSSLIAQKDSRVNLAIAGLQANDSRTLKGIAILTLLFLPSTLVAVSDRYAVEKSDSNRGQTLWTTNLFEFQGDTNWKVYITITAVLTFLVITCSWLYTRIFQRRDNDRWTRFAAYDLGFHSNSRPPI
jgi:Mg2+ and Co2+ transporter CorA